MNFDFFKYNSNGNDFIIIDETVKSFNFSKELIQKMCSRQFCIGADGLVLLQTSKKADFKMKMSGFVGSLIKWVLVIVLLGATLEILGLQLAFIDQVINYLPNLVVAVAIFIVAMIVADIAEKLVKAVVGKMQVKHVGAVGALTRWSVWIFAAYIILQQLGVQGLDGLIQIIVGGIVFAMAIAFGLGGKDVARELMEGFRNKLSE